MTSADRPRTPPRSGISFGEVQLDGTKSKESRAAQPVPGYIPHVFDFVSPVLDASSLTNRHIPPVFLEAEAVDSSVLLGHGASFTASLQKIPQGPKTIEITAHMEGWSVTESKPAPPRPSHVVYKTARVAFDENGEPLPEYRRALQSVITEFHALISPALISHPNVIDILGMAWGSNPFFPQHKLPALVVEYAEHGTLTELLQRGSGLDFDLRHLLCLDVARGLSALHQSGLVHGDVKADNVLICKSPTRKYIAKVSDFGFSMMAAAESVEMWLGGTDPWRAPETKDGPVRLDTAKYTDTYSFGLLAWSVCLDGRSPFDFVLGNCKGSVEVEELKKTDRLLSVVKSKDWLDCYFKTVFGSRIEEMYEAAVEKVVNQQASTGSARVQMMRLFSQIRDKAITRVVSEFVQKKLVRSLDDIADFSLQTSPESRDLDFIILVLESDIKELRHDAQQQVSGQGAGSQPKQGSKSIITNHSNEIRQFSHTKINDQGGVIRNRVVDTAGKTVDFGDMTVFETSRRQIFANLQNPASWESRGYKHRWLSWQKIRLLQPSVQSFVASSFDGSKESKNGLDLFMLCACYMNGYGCRSNVSEALSKLQQAVDLGHNQSQAFQHRIWTACRPEEDNPGKRFLEDYAKAGSRPAFEELRKVSPKNEFDEINRWITDASGGVGSDWLFPEEMLNGYTQSQWIQDGWLMERVNEAKVPLSQLIVNKRGDTVLHFTAMCGRWKPFKALVSSGKMDINLQNPLGETALLCSCRSGHGGIVILCLQQYKADASIAAHNGETAMHWLIRFDDVYIEPLLRDLVARGAAINAVTKERVSHSRYPGQIDVDFQLPGTPLTWAVHDNRPHIVRMLLKLGANPNHVPKGSALSALDYSAYFHHHECLKVIIEHLEGIVTQRTTNGEIDNRCALLYGPVVREAERAADKFSMILRGGADYLLRLHATFDLLREKTRLVNFQGQLQGSLLYTAVSSAHDEVVNYMFKHDWLIETINLPIGDARRTPVLEAIKWNREPLVQTLIDHGADIQALATNPFSPEDCDWSALHVFAHEGHDSNLDMVSKLVCLGLFPDGPASANFPKKPNSQQTPNGVSETATMMLENGHTQAHDIESPFAVAVRHNAFNLAKELLSVGADPNYIASKSGLFASNCPLTVLGHVIISNARYSLVRLNYLLHLETEPISFIVEPSRDLTALHRCAMAHQDVNKRTGGEIPRIEFDMDTNADIMYELLRKWRQQDELDATCGIDGNTALHLAILVENLATAKGLLEAGASPQIRNDHNETAIQLAEKLKDQSAHANRINTLLLSYGGLK